MIYDNLREEALKSAKKNSLVLESFFVGELFTYVLVKGENRSQVGIALTPNGEGNILEKNFKSLEELLNETSYNPSLRAVTLAAINAIGQYELQDEDIDVKDDLRDEIYDLIIKNSSDSDHIVFIGHLRPLIKKIQEQRENTTIFSRTKIEPELGVYNDIFECEAISKADIVVITGTTLIGSTIDAILKFASKARMVVISGFSAGANPIWFKNSGITHVASLCLKECKKEDVLLNDLETIFKNGCYIQKI